MKTSHRIAIAVGFAMAALSLAAQPTVTASAALAGPAVPIAHAGSDQTVEGGVVVTLDATSSWDADDDSLTFTWTQTEGPPVTLDDADASHPVLTAPTPGAGGVPAENQVIAFRLTASDGTNTSAPSEVRITVLKPFAASDEFAVVTTTACTDAGGAYAAGSFGAALSYAVTHPGTRVTFNIPSSDAGYNAVGGFWQFPPCNLPLLRYSTNPDQPLNANGTTIDGWSQTANATAAGVYVNADGPTIFVPGTILEVGIWQDPVPPSRIVIRGLAEDMRVSNANHLVLSGNYYNVMPDGLSQARGAGDHVGYSSGGTTCARLGILSGVNIRVGGATSEERNLFGGGCPMFATAPANHLPAIAGLKVVGNYFGVDRTGMHSILDQDAPGFGVQINGTREFAPVDAQFGGAEPGAGNLVSGFGPETALLVSFGAGGDRIVMLGNRFGTDASGTAAIANREGVVLQQMNETGAGPEWIVGGPEPGAGNLIAGSTGAGLYIDNQSGSDGGWRMRIQGNAIGTSADGLTAIPNRVGIRAETAGGDTLIGGAGRGEGNIVSGNHENGMYLDSYPDGVTPARVLGNLIGVGRDGVTPIGNGRNGITSWLHAQAVSVGGTGPGEANVIAFNGLNGYAIETCCGATPRRGTVRGNSIHDNGGIGIALSNGSTPIENNPGDAPEGPNDRRNHPVLLSATSGVAGTTITGTLDTIAGLSVTLDFYANSSADPSGFGEGERYLGTLDFIAAAGATPFTAVLPAVQVPDGAFISSTTTDAEGNTSEFSRSVAAESIAKAPSTTVIECPDVIYNGAPQTPCTARVTGAGGLDEEVPVDYTDNLNAGTASASALYAGDASYDASSASTTFLIAPAPLTVTADNATRPFGVPNPAFTATYSGLVSGETPEVLGGTLVFTTEATIASSVGSYDVFPSGLTSGNYSITFAKGTLEVTSTNTAPVCSAVVSIGVLWPPNHRMVPIDISGVTDADGDPIAIHVDAILQDEPTNTVGDGHTNVDGGMLEGGTRAWVRAERSGTPRVPGDGRRYEIHFTASDPAGGTCAGVVTVGVPHDLARPVAIDSGVRYDSTTGARVEVRKVSQ